MVEYILLLAVVVSLVITFTRSEMFNRYFGESGQFGAAIKRNNEFTYRHAYGGGVDVSRTTRDGGTHPSYYDAEGGGGSRFFGGRDPYP